MTKTRIQTERPAAKGKHQKPNTRWAVRENPPSGQLWGAKTWPGSGAGPAQTYGLWVFDSPPYVVPPVTGGVRTNNALIGSVTHIFLNKTQSAGGTGDPIAGLVVNDPIRLYSAADTSIWVEYKITVITDQAAYKDYTVTYTAQSPGAFAPSAGAMVLILEKTVTPAMYDPGDDTVAGAQAHVEALTLTGDELRAEIQRILDLERANKNRVTLVDWLDAKLGVI